MEKAVLALQMLVEGSSIRTTERITELHRDTILRLLVHVGEKCEKLMGRLIVNIPVKDVQCDELWGYVAKKEKNKGPEEAHDDSIGDAYCFVAIERHTKLILNFALGRRTQATTNAFIEGLRHATAPQPFQLTTDGFAPYLSAIDASLSDRVDYAMLVKQYAEKPEAEKRYSPAECIGCRKQSVIGSPDPAMISTSHVERQNLTIRMQMRRLTRLTNAFSKKWDNLWAAYCLHFAYYNFCRVHKTLRVTPAMESNLTDHVWLIAELLS
jgi:IS1 family transposase